MEFTLTIKERRIRMKKVLSIFVCITLIFLMSGCENSTTQKSPIATQTTVAQTTSSQKSTDQRVIEIIESLSLEQKVAQMLQPAVYNVLGTNDMKKYCYGSVLSNLNQQGYLEWQGTVNTLQKQAMSSDAAIPFIYGQDDVHGVNYCNGAVIYPHNIGIGAANDPELTYKMGLATADEAKLCHMLWTFSPCVAQAVDPRWGRTYESYSTDLNIIKNLSTNYTKGLIDGGLVACAKHFFADGNVVYGTGEDSEGTSRIIDRGDASLTADEIADLLNVYQSLVSSGVQTIMISHSSINGVKMHENNYYINYLKDKMGFGGFIVSDWNSIQNISGKNLKEKVIKSVNAGIDMLMQTDNANECIQYIIEGVNEKLIPMDRINDAVRRIIKVKLEAGVIDDPFFKNLKTVQTETGSQEYRDLACKLVEKSLVLVKNDDKVLPFKGDTKIFLMGGAANNATAQCGGWTGDWLGNYRVDGVTTIQEGLIDVAGKHNIEIITDQSRISEADAILLVIGETPYAEWEGDSENISIVGKHGIAANTEDIKLANTLSSNNGNLPIVTCIVAGRNVIIDDYIKNWDAIVMCYLPGSEGQGVANVLTGDAKFSGKLAMPWYNSIEQIGTDKSWLKVGYGLSY